MPASARVPNMATLLGIVLVWSIASTAVGAHESWINRGGYRNSAGEWCCGDNDCESPGQIAVTGKGWVIGGKEFVPFDEATPSPDGKILDLPPARSHTPLCIRTATRLVARRRCGKIRQISARFHKSTVAGRHFEKSLAGNAACRRILAGRTRAIRSAQTCRRPAGWRHHVVSSATAHLGNSRVTIRGASCSGGAAPQQT